MTASYPHRVGVATDETLNVVLFNGEPDETISLHAAKAEAAGKRWGCVLCRILDVLVEHGHCAKQLQPGTEKTPAALRAAALMAAVIWAIYAGIRCALFLIWNL